MSAPQFNPVEFDNPAGLMDQATQNKWRGVGKAIKGILPGVAALLGGPGIGAGVKILTEITGKKDPDTVIETIQGMDHDQILEAKRIDAEVTRKELEAEMVIHGDFTQRVMAEYQTGNCWLRLIRPGLTVFWTLLTTWIVLYTIHGAIPAGKELLVDSAFRFCATIEIAIVGFWFGSRGLEKITGILASAKEKPVLGKVIDIFRQRREEQRKEAA